MNLISEIEKTNKILESSLKKNEIQRIKNGEKLIIKYIICNHCNQKFEPFYFSGENEFGIIQDKNDDCPNCNNFVSFANPENKNSTEQKIKIFEFLYPSEIEEFGIIRYNKRVTDIEKILKDLDC